MEYEEQLILPVKKFLAKQHYEVYGEIPFFSKKIDLIGFQKALDEVVAVELKVKNWKAALRQAITDRLCSDRVYVGISKTYVHRVRTEFFAEWGIGILEVDGNVRVRRQADVNQGIHSSLKKMVESYILEKKSQGDKLVGPTSR